MGSSSDTVPGWRSRWASALQHLVYAGTATAVLRGLTRAQRDAGRDEAADVTLAGDEDRATAAEGVG